MGVRHQMNTTSPKVNTTLKHTPSYRQFEQVSTCWVCFYKDVWCVVYRFIRLDAIKERLLQLSAIKRRYYYNDLSALVNVCCLNRFDSSLYYFLDPQNIMYDIHIKTIWQGRFNMFLADLHFHLILTFYWYLFHTFFK